ncbi:hypothetical protein [Bacteroides propionicifaciens]|jgi:hypothetical protein|uniref:hypothetical protein n=1 Tax=Bacteroides propionicifaciens TaxID=392838 RepID=UPI00039C299B|nr:hypothetical protein [Bacteroides propionicifaciens]
MKAKFAKAVASFLTLCIFVITLYLIMEITGGQRSKIVKELSIPYFFLTIALITTLYSIWRKRDNRLTNVNEAEY